MGADPSTPTSPPTLQHSEFLLVRRPLMAGCPRLGLTGIHSPRGVVAEKFVPVSEPYRTGEWEFASLQLFLIETRPLIQPTLTLLLQQTKGVLGTESRKLNVIPSLLFPRSSVSSLTLRPFEGTYTSFPCLDPLQSLTHPLINSPTPRLLPVSEEKHGVLFSKSL